jgi:hypothetical protein
MSCANGLTLAFSSARSPAFYRRYRQHLLQTVGVARVELLFCSNPGRLPLTQVYNSFLEKARFKIVCLLHDDLIFFRNRGWGRQIISHFNKNPDFAILGAAGSLGFEQPGIAWSPPENMLGRLWHNHPVTGKPFLSDFSENLGEQLIEALTLDGLLLAIHKDRTAVRFNSDLSGFHFYDVQLTIDNWLLSQKALKRQKNGVMTNLSLKHLSTGSVDQQFDLNRQLTIQKYQPYLPLKQAFSMLKIANLKTGPIRQSLAIILLNLTPDLDINPCFELLSHLSGKDIQIYYGSVLAPKKEKLPTNLSLPIHRLTFALRDFSLQNALFQVFRSFSLLEFERILVWDTRIIPQKGTIERLLDFSLHKTALPLGTLGIRLHFSDQRVYFAGLDILRDQSGQIHCQFHGIHSAFRCPIKPKPTPYNHLGFTLLSPQHFLDLVSLSSGQNWIPGLEFNLNALKQGCANYLLADVTGIYRESTLEQSVSRYSLEQQYYLFKRDFSAWMETYGSEPAIQAWVRLASSKGDKFKR